MRTSSRATSLAPDAQGQLFGRKCRQIGYWVSTVVVALVMGYSGLVYLPHPSEALEELFALSSQTIVGLLQLLGSVVLLIPGLRRLKPWAYGAFAVLFSREIFSALASGEKRDALASSIALVLLAISFFLRPTHKQR